MNWPICRIEDVFEVARGGSPRPIQSYLTDSPDGINWIMIGDTSDGSKYITETKNRIRREGLRKTRMVHEGDFLLTNSMSFGRPYILKTSGCIHDGWLVLSPKSDNVSPDFFYYLLGSQTLYREFLKRAAGAVVKNLNSDIVRKITIPLPPLSEQKRIASILDMADGLRAKRRESLAQLDTLLQSTFLEMFGDPVTNPMGWEVGSIGSHIKVLGGFAFKSADFREDGVPVIRISNLAGDSIDLDGCARIPAVSLGKGERFKLQPGDTLIAMSGATTGKLGLVPDELNDRWYLNQRVGAFRVPKSSAVHRDFLRAVLRSSFYQDHVWSLAGGAAQPNISGKQLESAEIPLPPPELQHRFAAIVESVEQQKASQRAYLKELDTLFASLQSRAFQGEL